MLFANDQRHFIDTYTKKSIDYDGDLHELTLILKRADSQKPLNEILSSSPTPSQRDDWWLYNKTLGDDYSAQNEDPKIYAARKKLEELAAKERLHAQQEKAVSNFSVQYPFFNFSGVLRHSPNPSHADPKDSQVRKYLDGYKM
jgi:hypothetical protein